jgi:hypothetical protein
MSYEDSFEILSKICAMVGKNLVLMYKTDQTLLGAKDELKEEIRVVVHHNMASLDYQMSQQIYYAAFFLLHTKADGLTIIANAPATSRKITILVKLKKAPKWSRIVITSLQKGDARCIPEVEKIVSAKTSVEVSKITLKPVIMSRLKSQLDCSGLIQLQKAITEDGYECCLINKLLLPRVIPRMLRSVNSRVSDCVSRWRKQMRFVKKFQLACTRLRIKRHQHCVSLWCKLRRQYKKLPSIKAHNYWRILCNNIKHAVKCYKECKLVRLTKVRSNIWAYVKLKSVRIIRCLFQDVKLEQNHNAYSRYNRAVKLGLIMPNRLVCCLKTQSPDLYDENLRLITIPPRSHKITLKSETSPVVTSHDAYMHQKARAKGLKEFTYYNNSCEFFDKGGKPLLLAVYKWMECDFRNAKFPLNLKRKTGFCRKLTTNVLKLMKTYSSIREYIKSSEFNPMEVFYCKSFFFYRIIRNVFFPGKVYSSRFRGS